MQLSIREMSRSANYPLLSLSAGTHKMFTIFLASLLLMCMTHILMTRLYGDMSTLQYAITLGKSQLLLQYLNESRSDCDQRSGELLYCASPCTCSSFEPCFEWHHVVYDTLQPKTVLINASKSTHVLHETGIMLSAFICSSSMPYLQQSDGKMALCWAQIHPPVGEIATLSQLTNLMAYTG